MLSRVRRLSQQLRSTLGRYRLGLAMARSGPLREAGWFESAIAGQSIDREGRPIPWLSYPALYFLERRLPALPDLKVGEYGCGHSTLWWAERAARVVSVEHDARWLAAMAAKVPAHVQLIERAQQPERAYAEALCPHAPFDVIAIDGRNRVACAAVAKSLLSERGVILWDNSDRLQYAAGLSDLSASGFRTVPFGGLGPIALFQTETAILYRDGNLLGL